MDSTENTFQGLARRIIQTHQALQIAVIKAVNSYLTIRNWLIGYYIVEFEQNGEDRATYGGHLLSKLSAKLNIRGLSETNLKNARQFYQVYPEIRQLLTDEFTKYLSVGNIRQLPTDKFLDLCSQNILGTPSQTINNQNNVPELTQNMIQQISYTHFIELIKIDEPLKRQYYEMLILKTQLSVQELRRQIATLSFERLGLSLNKERAFQELQLKIQPASPADIVKSHYFFEFLGINQPELIEDSKLENALISNLQSFILELGNGFCFEARQKRILIGDEYFRIDLVFYHRILKCHVLIDLKVDCFNHSHASQLVAYLNYYKDKVMEKDDNPPVGILLVTDKNSALVEYVTANEKDHLFVSKYKLRLPDDNDIKSFIENELRKKVQY
ncbi:MAG TPA: DUF1016 family protein [Candidatus Marinimicrobia bacterium]|nr:DUF1016 family protein [Candidatus Neomarinimicrobiota bacterium]